LILSKLSVFFTINHWQHLPFTSASDNKRGLRFGFGCRKRSQKQENVVMKLSRKTG
jgi:hypothetical protein